MKKALSLFLTVVMAFSMFSCLGVVSSAATSDFIVDQKYTVSSETTKIFIPDETGYYKFQSNGSGDPQIDITCSAGEYQFDDNEDLNFSGTVYLTAGEEVICTFFDHELSDFAFTITKTVGITSVSINLVKPIEIMENTNGEITPELIWNEEAETEYEVEYYHYNTPNNLWYEGNVAIVGYSDGSSVEYICGEEGDYYSASGEYIQIANSTRQSYDNQWTVGSDNCIEMWVSDFPNVVAKVPVTIVENPYESVEFTPVKPFKCFLNTYGEMDGNWVWNDETQENEYKEYFRYYTPDGMYAEGNTVTAYLKDGTSEVYTCSFNEDDMGSYYYNTNGEMLDFDYDTNQSYSSQWTLGNNNYITVICFGKETQIPVAIVENPYESIEFTPVKPFEFVENTDGSWISMWVWDDETETDMEVEYFRYDFVDMHQAGNTITVNLKNGTSDVYTCDGYDYVNASGEILDWTYNYDQDYYNQWTIGSDNYITVEAFYVETQVPVTIKENPYESMEYIPAHSTYIKEQADYDVWGMVYETGNTIKLNRKDGGVEVYTCDGWDYYDTSEKYLNVETNYDTNDWCVGSDNIFTIRANGVSCDVYITITENETMIADEMFTAEMMTADTCIITDVTVPVGFDAILNIPETIEGCTVIGVEDGVLGCVYPLTQVNIPSTFNMISRNTFTYCDTLEAINVDENNTLFASVNGVLYNKALSEILYCPGAFKGTFVIAKDVTELSLSALAGLSNATAVEIEEGNTAFKVEDGVIYNADFTKIYKALETINKNYVMKDSVNEIAEYSFSGNDVIETVKFSAGVTDISYAAFSECFALKSVELPNGLVSISEAAFGNDSALSSISIPASTKTIGPVAFNNCSGMTELTLNEGIESIGEEAFGGASITKLDIPDSVKSIGVACFKNNQKLSSVTIGSGISQLPTYVFRNCTSLENIVIPDNIISIGDGAFYESGLTSINIGNKVQSIDRAFVSCDNLKTAKIGSGVTSLYAAFASCHNLEKVEFADGFNGDCSYAFVYCDKLSDVNVPSSVTEIAYYQFNGCEALTTLDIPSSLYKVDGHALDGTGWYNNQSNGDLYLEHVLYGYKGDMPASYTLNVKNGAKSIADYAFENETNLTKVVLPDGFKYIGVYGFFHCVNITEITIPSTVDYIGDYALGYYHDDWNRTKVTDFTIYGVVGSAAEEYATENEFTFVPIQEHTHTIVKLPAVAATCTKSGLTEGSKCSTCGEIIVAQKTVVAKGHTTVKLPAVAATCTKTGLAEGSKCSVCNAVLIAQKTVAAKGHTAVKLPAVAATCTKSGLTEGSKCSVCNIVLVAQKTVAANGHTTVKLPAVAATCTKAGLTEGSKCSVCNIVLVAQKTVAAKGHTASGWIVDKKATAAAPGSQHKECTACKVVLQKATIAQLAPATPKTTTANAVGGIKVSWNKVDGATKYVIFRRAAGTKSWVNIGTTTDTSLLDKNVVSGKYYAYSVRAYNSAGKYSAYNAKLTNNRKYMASPKLTTIYNHVNGLAIKWNAVGGVTNGYRVYRRGAGSTYWTYLGTTKNTYWIDFNVKNASGNYYRYTVIADGGYHSAFDTTGLYLKRLANPALRSATKGNAGITVKWAAVKGTTGYYVYRKTAGSTWKIIGSAGGTNNTAYLDKTAQRGVTYTYTVRACYGRTLSSYNSGVSCKR